MLDYPSYGAVLFLIFTLGESMLVCFLPAWSTGYYVCVVNSRPWAYFVWITGFGWLSFLALGNTAVLCRMMQLLGVLVKGLCIFLAIWNKRRRGHISSLLYCTRFLSDLKPSAKRCRETLLTRLLVLIYVVLHRFLFALVVDALSGFGWCGVIQSRVGFECWFHALDSCKSIFGGRGCFILFCGGRWKVTYWI